MNPEIFKNLRIPKNPGQTFTLLLTLISTPIKWDTTFLQTKKTVLGRK